jgi:hypothetical protein
MTPNRKIEKVQIKPISFNNNKIQNRLKQLLDIRSINNINQENLKLNKLPSLSTEASYINLNRRQNSANKINKNENILNNLYIERMNSFRMEKENIEKMKIKLQLIQKEKEEKQKEIMRLKKLEFKQQLESERQKIEESKKIKEQEEAKKKKEEEEKNNALIQNILLKSNEEKELEIKELSLDDASKHEFRLSLLNKYIKQYLEMDRKKDVIIVLELIHKIGQILKREFHYDKENSKENILSYSINQINEYIPKIFLEELIFL